MTNRQVILFLFLPLSAPEEFQRQQRQSRQMKGEEEEDEEDDEEGFPVQ